MSSQLDGEPLLRAAHRSSLPTRARGIAGHWPGKFRHSHGQFQRRKDFGPIETSLVMLTNYAVARRSAQDAITNLSDEDSS